MSEVPPASLPSRYIINGQPFREDPSFLAVGDKTIIPGGAAVTVSGTLLRLDSGGNLVVDASTLKLTNLLSTPSPSVYTVNGKTLTGNPSFLAVGGRTITVGGNAVTISGTPLRLDSGGKLIVDTSTLELANYLPATLPSVYTFNGYTFTGNPSFLAVEGKTITPGGAVATISGTSLRLDSGGKLIVDTSTLELASYLSTTLRSVYTVNGYTFTGNPSFLAIDGKTIIPDGAAATISGTLLRLDPGGKLVVDTSTLELGNFLSTPSPSVYTVNGKTLTGNSSFLAVGGQTITPGGAAATISGTPLRIDPGGKLVVGTSTLELASFLPTPLPSVYTVNGQTFTGNPSSLAVAGKTLIAGGATLSISGTPVILEPSGGALRFGTGEIIPLPTATASSRLDHNENETSAPPAAFLGGQARVQVIKKKTFWVGLWILGFLIIWL